MRNSHREPRNVGSLNILAGAITEQLPHDKPDSLEALHSSPLTWRLIGHVKMDKMNPD
jgi:hypothetical protein